MRGTRHLELTTAGSAGGEGEGEGRVEVLVFCILYVLLGSPPALQAVQEVRRGEGEGRVEVLVFCILYVLLGSPTTLQAVQVRGGRVKGVDALYIIRIKHVRMYVYLHMCMYVLHTYVVYIDNVHKIMHSYCQVVVCVW